MIQFLTFNFLGFPLLVSRLFFRLFETKCQSVRGEMNWFIIYSSINWFSFCKKNYFNESCSLSLFALALNRVSRWLTATTTTTTSSVRECMCVCATVFCVYISLAFNFSLFFLVLWHFLRKFRSSLVADCQIDIWTNI